MPNQMITTHPKIMFGSFLFNVFAQIYYSGIRKVVADAVKKMTASKEIVPI
jgi:hypothetical protein